ncbi:AMP-binding protein [Cytobacillus oceanisediminis]|uniref:AMP-binding protein n=1 Tax=Cytobacillus oceanisediminis TaxID=665099 RepID=UPI001C218678|nr:AMP-binding protein [Cytobacillus oceanisediminis]MBU8772068.1 AMP-binding protein [Cytobacillus oceanisediminis]
MTAIIDNYPSSWQPTLLHHYFLQHVKCDPHQIAIISENRNWTYNEFNKISTKFSQDLSRFGAKCGDRIVIISDPNPEAIALITACSMNGLVFVPIDPTSPLDRVMSILETTEPTLIVMQKGKDKITSHLKDAYTFIIMEESVLRCENNSVSPSLQINNSNSVLETDLAYIVFTSGSTGKPKGIMMTHRAVLSFFRGLTDYCQLSTSDKVGSIAPLHFDFSLLDMGLAFGSGATLVQIPRKYANFPRFIFDYLLQTKVTQLNCVPTVWKLLISTCKEEIKLLHTLRQTLFAGEAFNRNDLIQLQKTRPDLRIINCFGHSESIACTFDDIPNPITEEAKVFSIGKGHPGVQMLLISEEGNLINEPNIIGEIYLRGASLFSGYWKDEKATQSALIDNFLRPHTREVIFRSGDLAFKDEKGNYFFIGRSDFQVKISGYRIELEEVERIIMSHKEVSEVIVLLIQETLTAFIIPKKVVKDTEEFTYGVRKYCMDWLPNYMIPSHYKVMNQLPRFSNGKVNRQKLSEC